MQHIGTGDRRKIGAIVDREQLAVSPARVGDNFQGRQLVNGVEALVSELHDVDPIGEHRVQKLRQIALVPTGVRAQIQAGVIQGGFTHKCIQPPTW